MHPSHEVINILGSRAFDGLLDVGSISPVVLIPTGNNNEKHTEHIYTKRNFWLTQKKRKKIPSVITKA